MSVGSTLAPTGLCTHHQPPSKETCSTGLETGCKPVPFIYIFNLYGKNSVKKAIQQLLYVRSADSVWRFMFNAISKRDKTPSNLTLKGKVLNSMNVLGVICDSKLSWDKHISYVITKAEKALNALRLISKLFSSKQLLQLLFAEVWCHYYQGPARQRWHKNRHP